jgi:hypothetical protein
MSHNRSNYFRQHQRFLLTSAISTIMNDVNEKRWHGNGSALPPFNRRSFAFIGEGGAYDGRAGQRSLSGYSLD